MQKAHTSVNTHVIYITPIDQTASCSLAQALGMDSKFALAKGFSQAAGRTVAAGRFGLGVWLWMLPGS